MADRREQLLGWIAATRRTQRRLGVLTGVLAVASVALALWRPGLGGLAFVLTAIIGGSGFWITTSHVADWNHRLQALRTDGSEPRIAGGGKRF